MLTSLAAVFLLSGCASDIPQQTRRYVWPRPPDQPRIEWLKSYYSADSFPKSGFASAMEIIFGKPDAITFEKPIDIKSNGKGIVYVTDIALQGILVYDLVNYTVKLWARGTDVDMSLGINPYYISLDSEENIYVVGSGPKLLYILDKKGSVLKKIDLKDQIKATAGILADSKKKRIYLVDNGGQIVVYDFSGKYLFTFGKFGEQDGELNRPSPIAMNSKGEIIVGDVMNGRIQIFDGEGKFLRKFGQRGDGGAEFQVVKGLSVDSDDNIYVTDGKANQIKIFSSKGEYLMSMGTAYSVPKTYKEAPGGFLIPQGIYIDSTDTIYVADQANMRFQVFKYLKESSASATVEVEKPAVK